MQFRKDINGLRAIAVLPVLFFHAGLTSFSGGFLGVDVFFTISGFLITTLIIKSLNEGTFSILFFYNKRARRILPALLFVVTLTTCLSFIVMLPYDLKNYGQSIVATVLSANNILLYVTSGYWSLASEFKPLYHTWSLAVEEQYYLIIPILILVCFTFTRNKLKISAYSLLILMISSFTVSFYCIDSELNFLIITHRMWELLFGSIIAILMINRNVIKNNLLSFLGLFLLCLSYTFPYFISSNQALYSLIPVFGTGLIIIFSSDNIFFGKILSLKPLFIVGTVSYSIYLFHMPILAILRLSTEGRPNITTQVLFSLISVPMAYLSWKFIETPCRDKKIISDKTFYIVVASLSFSLLLTGLMLHKTYGLQSYFPEYSYGNNPQKYADQPCDLQHDSFTSNEKKNILVMGDSFARDFINMLKENNIFDQYEIIYIKKYMAINLGSLNSLVQSSDYIFSVSSEGMSSKEVDPEALKLSSQNIYDLLHEKSNGNVYRIGTKSFGLNNNFIRRIGYEQNIDYKIKPNATALLANKIERSIWGNNYIDVIHTLSDLDGNVRLFTPEGKFISFDTDHTTKAGAKYVGKLLLENTYLQNLIKERGINK